MSHSITQQDTTEHSCDWQSLCCSLLYSLH